jgi:AraC-like DNA-binding protein
MKKQEIDCLNKLLEYKPNGSCSDNFDGIHLYGHSTSDQGRGHQENVRKLENHTGTGEISCYHVLQGIEVYYNDIHMEYCLQNPPAVSNAIEINHCREGRFECSFGENKCCYLAKGDLAICSLEHKKSETAFPLSHYHGVTILIKMNEFSSEVKNLFSILNIDIDLIQEYIYDENRCCIMRANKSIEHIFSELYHIREERRRSYMQLKVLELLLFLSDLDLSTELVTTEYVNQKQVMMIKSVKNFITEDITKHYTVAELADRFNVSPTSLKNGYHHVYGTSIYAFLKYYRLQTAGKYLAETDVSVTEIAAMVGYENPNKFSSAFKEVYRRTPSDFRRCVQMDSRQPFGVAENIDLS